ncbi:MAG: TIGR03435 family protein [Terracidiphilus sp.]
MQVLFAGVLFIASTAVVAEAQSPATPAGQTSATPEPIVAQSPRFEVVSIHPHQSAGDDASSRQVFPGGRFVATATSVRTLIRIAFGTEDNLISGAPRWIDNETFDVNAVTAGHAEVTTPQQFQQLILSLLEDRFELKFHREQKEVPVYWLELDKPGKLGPGLKPSAPDSEPSMSTNSNGARTIMKVTKGSMTDIAAGLRRQSGRPVEDHTGLKGTYDFEIQWAPEETPDSADPSLFTVLKEQLGLKLRAAKGTDETLVIDHIAEPSDN